MTDTFSTEVKIVVKVKVKNKVKNIKESVICLHVQEIGSI